jgi:hypothetical protein
MKTRQITRIGTGIALGLLLAAAMSGCGGSTGNDGVATANGTAGPTTGAPAGPVDEKENAVKFGQCMRDNGVPNFPDPKFNDGGGMSIDAPEGAEPAKVDAAMQKCKPYMPNGGEPKKLDPERLEQLRKMSQCMRDRGVKNFPDPTENGLQADGNQPGMDPSDPTFQAAMKECEKFAPPPAGETPGTSRGDG